MIKQLLSDSLASAVRPITPVRKIVVAGAGVLALVAVLSPWATFSGFPGNFSLAGWPPGGARDYVLALVVAAVLATFAGGERRGAALATSLGSLVVVVQTIWAINSAGGGLVNVAWGAWLALVATLLLTAAALSMPGGETPLFDRVRIPAAAEIAVVIVSMLVLLQVIVVALRIEVASQFIAYFITLGFVMAALKSIGFFDWLSGLNARYHKLSLAMAGLIAVVFPFTQDGNAFWIRVGASIGVFAAAAIGLNVVVGLAGLLDLGYIAFFGVGAYVGALFAGAASAPVGTKTPFLVVIILGAIVAGIFGVLIGAPTLRLRGDYLAIVTLGFGEIFRIAVGNLDGQDGPNITNGSDGIPNIPNLEVLGLKFGEPHELFGVVLPAFANYYFAELVLLLVVIVIFTRLNSSRIGRAWVAIREDETAAEAMGINTVRMKLLAFGIGALLAGAAGTLNAHLNTQVSPDSYKFDESILLLAAVVLGGMGTVAGALLGSAFLFVIPNKLRALEDKRLMLFGIALILMMRFRPEGLIASKRRQRELHESGDDSLGAAPGTPLGSEAPL